jgi:predicted site-specific integrase-resolvase
VTTALDERAAAPLLGVSVHTLRRWRRDGRGPAFVKFRGRERRGRGFAGRVVYRREDLEAFLGEMRVVTENPSPEGHR